MILAPCFLSLKRIPVTENDCEEELCIPQGSLALSLHRSNTPYLLQVEDGCWNSLHTFHCLLWIWRFFTPQNILIEVQLPFYSWVIRLKIKSYPQNKQFFVPLVLKKGFCSYQGFHRNWDYLLGWGCISVMECLSRMCEALSLTPQHHVKRKDSLFFCLSYLLNDCLLQHCGWGHVGNSHSSLRVS